MFYWETLSEENMGPLCSILQLPVNLKLFQNIKLKLKNQNISYS